MKRNFDFAPGRGLAAHGYSTIRLIGTGIQHTVQRGGGSMKRRLLQLLLWVDYQTDGIRLRLFVAAAVGHRLGSG